MIYFCASNLLKSDNKIQHNIENLYRDSCFLTREALMNSWTLISMTAFVCDILNINKNLGTVNVDNRAYIMLISQFVINTVVGLMQTFRVNRRVWLGLAHRGSVVNKCNKLKKM